MTVKEKKNSAWAVFLHRGITIAYYAFSFFWLVFPAVVSFHFVPTFLGFLWNVGGEVRTQYNALINCGYAFTLINVLFLMWHYLIKRYRAHPFENKFFLGWVLATNIGLFAFSMMLPFQASYSGHSKY